LKKSEVQDWEKYNLVLPDKETKPNNEDDDDDVEDGQKED